MSNKQKIDNIWANKKIQESMALLAEISAVYRDAEKKPAVLDAELKAALELISNRESSAVVNCDGHKCLLFGDKSVNCVCPEFIDLTDMTSRTEQHLINNRDIYLAEAARLKAEREKAKEQAEIEKERKRVVGKWCLNDKTCKYSGRYVKIIDIEKTDIINFVDNRGEWHSKAIPLTDTQLTALGLENEI